MEGHVSITVEREPMDMLARARLHIEPPIMSYNGRVAANDKDYLVTVERHNTIRFRVGLFYEAAAFLTTDRRAWEYRNTMPEEDLTGEERHWLHVLFARLLVECPWLARAPLKPLLVQCVEDVLLR